MNCQIVFHLIFYYTFCNPLSMISRWMICAGLNNLYYVEWFALRWMICTTLNDLNYVEWFVLRWKICTTLNDFNYVDRFVLRWVICTALKDLNYVKLFGVRWIICSTLNQLDYDGSLRIGFLTLKRLEGGVSIWLPLWYFVKCIF